ncbi:8-amino-7-oxononanoate synthase [Denitratisoma oestradiolicum]|uniref:8-amino-7-oxononanoate synthase n=1 Tax=Denitratisoma oestradiolicum TaxID=311182 RepID=A0A6S6XYH5_9PROT|nr:8-amino-7-oxononanoate synthase [Denitratisoma oestradiolicum]TWO79046.1 8-amino-7-oxononanoate synthase [Denitratisoma oestradiolicum]CAB1369417.1 8-amino-7-oxononanoate synthase [Denitratisoma oestradiolicum]
MVFDELELALAELDRAHLRRHRRVLESPAGPRVTVEGRRLLSFCSNDYLGLAAHPELIAALAEGARGWGAGSGASALLGGHLVPHEALEQRLAGFLGLPRALTFTTGYLANLAVTPALVGRGDEVFADRLNHASLIDAVVLSRARHRRYPHNDSAALERLLKSSTARRKLILTDSVFSMDGDMAALDRLLVLAEEHDAWLVVDDAHGFGVLGQEGRGALSHFGLQASPRLVLMGTLGKAAGVGGAFVAGDERVVEWLISRGRSYVFSTAPPPALAAALLMSIDLIEAGEGRRQHLQALITRLRGGLAPLAFRRGWRLADSAGPIQPLIVGDTGKALELSAHLERLGLWVPAIRPPTVPEGSSRLRISLSAAHGESDVDTLLAALEAAP